MKRILCALLLCWAAVLCAACGKTPEGAFRQTEEQISFETGLVRISLDRRDNGGKPRHLGCTRGGHPCRRSKGLGP